MTSPSPAAAAPPVAITMWDFSWLLRRSGAQAEYADVDRVLDELAERGYQSVRIDAFPHWIAADVDGGVATSIDALPQDARFMWGNHQPVTVQPLPALREFLTGLRRRGLRAALSTWLTADASGRSDRVATPADLGRIWVQTLAQLEASGHLDVIDYVDLCNEWPLFTPGPRRAIWPDGSDDRPPHQSWSDEEVARIDGYAAAVAQVKHRFPQLPVLFSYCLRGAQPPAADDCMRLATDAYDLAELHLWLTSTPRFTKQTDFMNGIASRAELARHQHEVEACYWEQRPTWQAELDALMDRWKSWADTRGLPVWTTECWASVFWDPDLSESADPWAYIKDVAEHAVPRAVAAGWAGVATSNFSQPHHAGLWADIEWHRRLTETIRAGRSDTPDTPGLSDRAGAEHG